MIKLKFWFPFEVFKFRTLKKIRPERLIAFKFFLNAPKKVKANVKATGSVLCLFQTSILKKITALHLSRDFSREKPTVSQSTVADIAILLSNKGLEEKNGV